MSGQQQRKHQGSGESAMEKISPDKEDDLSSISSVVSRARDSPSNGASAISSRGKQSRHLLKSEGGASFTGEVVLLEDFPSTRQPSSALKLPPADMETDMKKPWMTAPRTIVLDKLSSYGSQESMTSDREIRSDGSDQLSYMKVLTDDVQLELVKTSQHGPEAAIIDEIENTSENELISSKKFFLKYY
jgi:hypothetical protein